jgi:cell wall-associated NlpC family hydrolase
MPEYYPVKANRDITASTISHLKLAGLDCSGLLYEATAGFTPRNTGELLHFGEAVRINGDGTDGILQKLQPLDLIVWPGHVLIVIGQGEIIESRLFCDGRKDGVVISRLRERVADIMATRKPVDAISNDKGRSRSEFVVRRWFPARR